MKQTFHTTAVVKPGRRIEINVPELAEGESVEVFLLAGESSAVPPTQRTLGIFDYLKSLPATIRTEEEWRKADEEFINDRKEWDR